GQPREAGLERLQRDLLEQRAVVAHRTAPLLVVVADVLGRRAAPPAAAVDEVAHGASASIIAGIRSGGAIGVSTSVVMPRAANSPSRSRIAPGSPNTKISRTSSSGTRASASLRSPAC